MRIGKIVIIVIIAAIALDTETQVVPPGKFNVTNYPKDRAAIDAIRNKFDSTFSLNDNYVGIGAEGMIYYGKMAELKSMQQSGVSFKSVTVVPGTSLLRIFNGNSALKTFVADVVFTKADGELYVKVIRQESYVKQGGKWFYVAGQDTMVQTPEELQESMKKHTIRKQ
ncbi:MAG: hypothetical protein ABJA37_07610 [Ferruginibacter sp.]